MRLAIADPPYLGRAALWYGGKGRSKQGTVGRAAGRGCHAPEFHPDAHEWDDPVKHIGLMVALTAGLGPHRIRRTPMNEPIIKDQAEHVAETLAKGMRIIVYGRLKSRSYETREGERRTVFEVDVDEVGPSLRYATATATRTQGGQRPQQTQQTQQQPVRDPWAGAGTEAHF